MRMKNLLTACLLLSCSLLFAQPTQFAPRGVGGGGALFFPRINPGDDKEFYVSCDLSALFHSTDFGDNYSQVHFQKLSVFGAQSTYEFTNDPQIAYSNYSDGNEGYPVRTLDGGQSWQPLPGHDFNEGQVYRMAANYQKPAQLLINYYGSIYFSNDKGQTLQLVKAADDNGVGLIMGGTLFEGNNIYIGTNEGIYRSTNSGQSFSLLSASGLGSGEVIWSFAAAKQGSTTRFVCITGNAADIYNGLMPWEYWQLAKGVYVMDDVSGSWQSKSAGIDFEHDFVMFAGMAWNDVNTIYLGGSDEATGGALVFKSINGGDSWEKVFKTEDNENIKTGWSGYQGDKNWSWGETCFGITVAPNNSQKVMFGDFGFVHLTSDGGASWKQAYVKNSDQHPAGSATPKRQSYHSIGLENTTSWQVHWSDADHMLSAYSDIGLIRSTDGGVTWGFNYSGVSVNSVYRIVKSAAGTLFIATSGIHDMYQSTRLRDAQLDANDASGKIFYSTDNGASWTLLHAFNHPVFWLALDPNNPNRLYASVIHYGGGGASMQGGIWKTDDLNNLAGAAWTQLPAPPRTQGHAASIQVLNDGKVAASFSGRIDASGHFTPSSGAFLYDPATNTWSDRSDAQMQYWTKDLVLDPQDATQSTWYAGVFSGWGGGANDKGGLYRSPDRGLHWTKLTDDQFDRVTSLTFNPQNPKQAYLTTETQGLWISNNMDAATPNWTLLTAYPYRQPERVYFNPFDAGEMWVSSFGNGMKVGSLTPVSTVEVSTVELRLWPNPASDFVQIDLEAEAGTVSISDALGREVWKKEVEAGRENLRIGVKDWAPGLYQFRHGGQSCWFLVE